MNGIICNISRCTTASFCVFIFSQICTNIGNRNIFLWSRRDGERRFIVLDLFSYDLFDYPLLLALKHDAICLTISFIVSNIVEFFFLLLLFCHLLMLGYALMSDSCCCFCYFLLIIYFAFKQRAHEKTRKGLWQRNLLSCSQFNTKCAVLALSHISRFFFF